MTLPQLQSISPHASMVNAPSIARSSARFSWKLWLLILGCLTWFALQPLVMYALAERWIATTSMLWISYCPSAAGMGVGCWAALIPGKFLKRCGWGLWSAACVWLIWSGSLLLLELDEYGWARNEPANAHLTAFGGAHLVLSFLLISALRQIFGLRFVSPAELALGDADVRLCRQQFSLAQAFYGVALLALFLGIAREVAPRDCSTLPVYLTSRMAWAVFQEWAKTMLIILPAALLIARSTRGAIVAIGYFGTLTAALIIWNRWAYFPRLPSLLEKTNVVLFEGLFRLEFLLYVTGPLLAARWLGYQLECNLRWPWRRK